MRILICNNRYFPSTGPERYLFNVTALLESHGHTVIPLAIAWDENMPTPYAKYFVPPPIDGQSVYFRQYKDRLTLQSQWRLFARSAYSQVAKDAAARIIEAEGIDLMYVLHVANMLSPSVVDAAADRHIPVVMRLSDFNMVCPANIFLRDGKVCQECLHGLQHAIQHRCVQDSVAVTTARVLAMQVQRRVGVFERVNAYIAPSRYMVEQMEQFPPTHGKIHHIPSFMDVAAITPATDQRGYLLFFGRVAPDKGVEWLLRAHAGLAPMVPLIIAGTSSDGEQERLEAIITAEQRPLVTFAGFQSGQALNDLIDGALAIMQPSLWHDNAPMSVYESLAHGKAVIGSRMGGIAEQVTPECGLLVTPHDVAGLRAAMQTLIDDPARALQLGRAARQRAEAEFTPEMHYKRLMQVFTAATQEKE